MSNEPRVLAHSIPAAGRMLGIGRTTMYELLARGEIRSIRLGGRRLIPESELQRIIAERMEVAA